MTCENNCPVCKCNLPKGMLVGADRIDSESGLPVERGQVRMSEALFEKISEATNGTQA